ncbi:hypothetical protein [Halomicrobium sp. LC1Hm]|uniref:hypothetical protein n=1 Tax=Halomicrobium sp. LC1Hm TaxID=2610902 RepID=UPI0012982B6C|nr:hypothetical protein [Halomicrobium sp. LC1Hm]
METNGSEATTLSDQISTVVLDRLRSQSNELEKVANQSLSIIKANLVILGLFLPVVSSLFGNDANISQIFNSIYTQIGLGVWLVSTVTLITVYHLARSDSVTQLSPVNDLITGDLPANEFEYDSQSTISSHSDRLQIEHGFVTISLLLSLVSIGLFSLGVILPYVDVEPATGILKIVAPIGASLIISYSAVWLIRSGKVRFESEKQYHDLSKPRQEVLEYIYDEVGDDDFHLTDVVKDRKSGVLGGDRGVSEFLLKELVSDGFFASEVADDEIRLNMFYGENKPISEAGDEVQRRLDHLGQLLEQNDEAKSAAADEIRVKPEEVLDKLSNGTRLDVIQRYNRIAKRMEEEGLDLSGLLKFDLVREDLRLYPTEKARSAFEAIERKRNYREHEREKQQRLDEIQKDANTHTYMVTGPADEEDTLQVAPHDPSVHHDEHSWLYLPNSDLSDEEIEQLRDLELHDTVQLRIERNAQTDEEYIADLRRSE